MHDENCFITLTYNPENLPENGTLVLKHFQDFMKRFRKKHQAENPYPKDDPLFDEWEIKYRIKFYHCGEYGGKGKRPHYHACIFGFQFKDLIFFKEDNGNKIYISKDLENLWGKGFVTVGEVTFDSAAYVARYITKKITGDHQGYAYGETVNTTTGEINLLRKPEYNTMSRRPGIGKTWFDKYGSDVYPTDTVIIKGKQLRPPKYYDSLFEHESPKEFEKLKARRIRESAKLRAKNPEEYEYERLAVKEKISHNNVENKLPRRYENEEILCD